MCDEYKKYQYSFIVNKNVIPYKKIKNTSDFNLQEYNYIVVFEKHELLSFVSDENDLFCKTEKQGKILLLCMYDTYNEIRNTKIGRNINYVIKINRKNVIKMNIYFNTIKYLEFMDEDNTYLPNNGFRKYHFTLDNSLSMLTSSVNSLILNLKTNISLGLYNLPNKIIVIKGEIDHLLGCELKKLPYKTTLILSKYKYTSASVMHGIEYYKLLLKKLSKFKTKQTMMIDCKVNLSQRNKNLLINHYDVHSVIIMNNKYYLLQEKYEGRKVQYNDSRCIVDYNKEICKYKEQYEQREIKDTIVNYFNMFESLEKSFHKINNKEVNKHKLDEKDTLNEMAGLSENNNENNDKIDNTFNFTKVIF